MDRQLSKRSVQALLGAGLVVVLCGLVLAGLAGSDELHFQEKLLTVFKDQYRWRSLGFGAVPLSLTIVGATMMAAAALLAAFLERRPPPRGR